MKNIFLVIVILLFGIACSGPRNATHVGSDTLKVGGVTGENSSEEKEDKSLSEEHAAISMGTGRNVSTVEGNTYELPANASAEVIAATVRAIEASKAEKIRALANIEGENRRNVGPRANHQSGDPAQFGARPMGYPGHSGNHGYGGQPYVPGQYPVHQFLVGREYRFYKNGEQISKEQYLAETQHRQ